MSGGTSPDVTDFPGWMRDINRRMRALENRPPVTSALDLLGPGIDSSATFVSDWNDDTAYFNGMYYSEVGTDNAPDTTSRWVGLTIIDDTGSGYQLLTAVPATDTDPTLIPAWTQLRRHRVFNTPANSTRVYSPWATP